MREYTLLSHALSASTPTPGGRPPLRLETDESLEQGFPGNTYYYTAWNHAGTHVDAPAHMHAGGRTILEVPIGDLIFHRPFIVDVPKKDDQLITSADLRTYEQAIAASDFLLLRTGCGHYRDSDPVRYRDRNPGLSVDAARYLNATRFPLLRAVGIDTISMAAASHVEEGIEAHRILFARKDGSSILLVEDMLLAPDLARPRRVFVVPLFIEGLDSSPCTIVAELDVD
jgi:kynurenine formamidase